MTKGVYVRDGARRRVRILGRRIGEVERPRARTVVPLLGVPCDGRGGGAWAWEAADRIEAAELAWKICLEELLSGILDKRLRPSPVIADRKIISAISCRYFVDDDESGWN